MLHGSQLAPQTMGRADDSSLLPTRQSVLYPGTELGAMAEAQNYYRWIADQLSHFLGKRVMEIGAGIGTLASYLLAAAPASEFILLEPAENLFPILERRYRENRRVKLVRGNLEESPPSLSMDSVVLVNVLEHVESDEYLLQRIYRTLRPGGNLLLFVPALPRIYGSLDEGFGHIRRYTKTGLAQKLRGAGFCLGRLRYLNLPGAACWFLAGKLLRQKTLRPAEVRFYDRWVVPWCSKLERRWEPPIGQSLVAVALK